MERVFWDIGISAKQLNALGIFLSKFKGIWDTEDVLQIKIKTEIL